MEYPVLALSLTSCVALINVLPLSKPRFPHFILGTAKTGEVHLPFPPNDILLVPIVRG